MNFHDNDFSFEANITPSRLDVLSLYDTNSRDSGFEEISKSEVLSNDAFLEEFAEITFSGKPQLPTDFINLIEKPITITVTVQEKPTFQRVLSTGEIVSPLRKKICPRRENVENREHSFLKRRKKMVKKLKSEEYSTESVKTSILKSFNSEEAIKSAIQRSYSEPDLIADFSRSYFLPAASSSHQDLRAIDSKTLKQLLNGEFNDRIGSFKIIDCRYPYEYNGGHIKGAINMFTREQCLALLKESCSPIFKKPEVLIFHCEFSSERGPNLYRYLRQEDRRQNAPTYPSLCFPEIYILKGGYNNFFKENSSLCTPSAYTQMLDPRHSKDLAYFRQFSKTWVSDIKYSMRNRYSRKFVFGTSTQ